MSLADTRVLARRCPACRRREPGLLLPHGTWEGWPRYCRQVLWGGEREHVKRDRTVRRRVPSRGRHSDRLIVVMKPL